MHQVVMKALKLVILRYKQMKPHNGNKPYLSALFCDTAFFRTSIFQKHMMIHTGETPHFCSQCDKAFSKSISLKHHMRIQTSDKPYQCSQCDKAFNETSALMKHMRNHTGEKPYQCSQCDKAFTQAVSLKLHTRTHNGENHTTVVCVTKLSLKVVLLRNI